MAKTSYKEPDYAFGQLMFKLRMALNLTQAGLAQQLEVSRHAVGAWESGLSYPKAERMKQLMVLGVQASAFATGHEAEEIRAFWKASRQKVQLDEGWLDNLLAAPASRSPVASMHTAEAGEATETSRPINWIGALDVSHFTGREVEVARLTQWIVQERCRMILLLGMGGIGKSTLASFIGQRVTPQFEVVLWYSVRDAPLCEDVVTYCITFFSETPPIQFPPSLEQRITQLLVCLQARRCLLVLDNFDTLLESGDQGGDYVRGYEGYGRLLQQLAEVAHQSCVLLTSREKPREIQPVEGVRGRVRSLRLVGVDGQTAQAMLANKGLRGTTVGWQQLVVSYAGNPLALKIVAQIIAELFASDIDRFLQEGSVIFNGIRSLLRQQVERLTPLEHLLLTWLAVLREWTSLETLHQVLVSGLPRTQMLEALEALGRRSLLEQGQQARFSLQSVVMEYLSTELVERLNEEIVQGKPKHLRRYALEQGQAKDYIRQTQVRLLVQPLLEQLRSELGADAQVEAHLFRLLSQFRCEHPATQGYGPANIISLLKALRGHLQNLDLSRLSLRNVSLQGVEMQDTTLAHTVIQNTVFTERIDDISRVAISSTGEYWAAGNRRGEIRVWERDGMVLHRIWRAHTDMVWALTFSPDGRTLASGSSSGSIKLWDITSGALLRSDWLTRSITWLAFSPSGDRIASAGLDEMVRFWDPWRGNLLQVLPHTSGVLSLAWTLDGKLLASGCSDGSIWLWKPRDAQPTASVRRLMGHTYWVAGLAFSPAGMLASGGYDGIVRVWDPTSERCLQTFSGHSDRVIRVVWSSDGQMLASCSVDRTIRLWSHKDGSPGMVLRGHTAAVSNLAFTPDGCTLLSGSNDGTVRVWDIESGQCLRIIGGYAASYTDIDWSPDGQQLVSCGADALITLWGRDTIAVGSHGQRGLPAASTATVEQLELFGEEDPSGSSSLARLRVFHGHQDIVQGVAWSPNGDLLASAGHDGIGLWKPTTSLCLHMLQDPDTENTIFQGVAWCPNGHLLACGTYVRGVQVWDVATRTRLWIGHTAPTRIRHVAWNPDGTRLAGGGDDGHVYVWDATDGRLQHDLTGPEGVVMSVAWSPNGSLLASGGGKDRGELFIWDALSGECLSAIKGYPAAISAFDWSPDGEVIISGDNDGRLRWCRAHTGEQIQVREGHQGIVFALKVSPDGRRLASCGDDGAIMLWTLEHGEMLQTLRRDRPYERVDITGIQGLSVAQKASLLALGAHEEAEKGV